MRRMSQEESAPFEEHLLTCDVCRARVEESDSYVGAMRRAASQIESARERRGWFAWTPRPALFRPAWWAALASVAAVLVVAGVTFLRTPEPLPVTLQAMRGMATGAKVEANRPLLLSPDLTGLPEFASYSLEIVDANGNRVFRGEMSNRSVPAPRLREGMYFARIYSPSGQLLREYGLEAAAAE